MFISYLKLKDSGFIWIFLTDVSLDTFRCQNETELTFLSYSHIVITTTFQEFMYTARWLLREGLKQMVEKYILPQLCQLASIFPLRVVMTCATIKANLTF